MDLIQYVTKFLYFQHLSFNLNYQNTVKDDPEWWYFLLPIDWYNNYNSIQNYILKNLSL